MLTLIATAATIAHHQGLPLRIVHTHGSTFTTDIGATLADAGFPLPERPITFIDRSMRRHGGPDDLPVHADDVFVVSAWWDAHVARGIAPPGRLVYLIQDYEPIFYPNGDEQLLAEATYSWDDTVPLFNTSVLREFFIRRYPSLARGEAFEPAVNRCEQVITQPRGAGPRVLFLYARPTVARNLYWLALKAIEAALARPELVASGPWRVLCAGTDALTPISIAGATEVVNLGKLSVSDYVELLGAVDLGVSPMLAPHPNYPTLELASAGVPTVTTTWETKTDLSRYSSLIFMADPTVDSMRDAICAAASSTDVDQTCMLPTNWATSLNPVMDYINTSTSKSQQ